MYAREKLSSLLESFHDPLAKNHAHTYNYIDVTVAA